MPTQHRIMARPVALIVIVSSLIALAGCGSSTTAPRAHATATTTRTPAATATATALPDPAQTPTTTVLGATPSADPSQCSPASTVAPLPTTFTTLYTLDANETIRVLNAGDGSTRWSYATGTMNGVDVVPDGTMLYASFYQQSASSPTVVALGSADGAVAWQAHLPNPSTSATYGVLTVAGGVVYTAMVDGTLHALDGATGTERWSDQVGSGIPQVTVSIPQVTVSGGIVYAQNSGADGGLVALRASDGTLLWRYPTAGHVTDLCKGK